MKTITGVEIKSGRKEKGPDGKAKVVATIDIKQFDSVQEACLDLSESVALGLINTQYATNAKNKARAEATGEPSSKNLRNEAFIRILGNPELTARLTAASQDPVRSEAVIEEVVNEIKKEKGIGQTASADDTEDATD